jgi:hypothetical protein
VVIAVGSCKFDIIINCHCNMFKHLQFKASMLVNGQKYSSPSMLRYIFHIKPHFSKKLLWSISKRILIIFAPEEAEIFKDYLFILAWFSVKIAFIFLWIKDNFCFPTSNFLYIFNKNKIGNKTTFVFKSPENHEDKNYYQIKK